jgi:hypothetical protein
LNCAFSFCIHHYLVMICIFPKVCLFRLSPVPAKPALHEKCSDLTVTTRTVTTGWSPRSRTSFPSNTLKKPVM